MSSKTRKTLLSFLLAMLFVVLAFAIKFSAVGLTGHYAPFTLFFVSISLSTLIGGLPAGALAAVLSGFFAHEFFLSQPHLPQNVQKIVHLAFFAIDAGAICFVAASLRSAKNRLETERSQLEEERRRFSNAAAELQREVRERELAESELRRTMNRMRHLGDSDVVAIAIAGLDGRISDANDHFLDLTGYSREDLKNGLVCWKSMTPPEFAALDEKALQEISSFGRCRPFEKQFLRKDGSRTWVLLGVALLPEEGLNTIACAVDISKIKELEALLKQQHERLEATNRSLEAASQMKDQFFATLSHELRTPLHGIIGWISLLQQQTSNPVLVDSGLKAIEESSEALNKLVDEMLDMSRITSGKLTLDLAEVELVGIARHVVESVRFEADTKGVRLDFAASTESLVMVGDRNRLRQVVTNLINNAVKFTNPGGEVLVRVEPLSENRAGITVKDSGVGIAPEMLAHIFERFSQGQTRERRQGLGLGLAIVRHIVELHGGRVTVESPGLGKGSLFRVELPFSGEEPKVGG